MNGNTELSEAEIKKLKAQQGGKSAVNLAGKAFSTYYGGAKGTEMYDKLASSKLGQKNLDKIGENLGNTPGIGKALEKAQPALDKADSALSGLSGSKKNNQTNSFNSSNNSNNLKNGTNPFGASNSEDSNNNSSIDIKKIKKLKKLLILIPPLFLGFVLIVIITGIMMGGLICFQGVKESIDDNLERLGNFLTFKGWCTDSECDKKAQNDFYEHVKEVARDYREGKYHIELNTNLIIATLTYNDPFTTVGDSDSNTSIEELASEGYDFKKGKKKVKTLAENMVSKKKFCYLYNSVSKTSESVDCDFDIKAFQEAKKAENATKETVSEEDEPGSYKKTAEEKYVLDLEKYRSKLPEFIRKYYFNNKKSKNIDNQIDIAVEEIFSRVSFLDYLNNEDTSSGMTAVRTTSQVTLKDCTGAITQEQLTIDEYLQGVLYMQSDSSTPYEYLKVLALTERSKLYKANGATLTQAPTYFTASSCGSNYCSVKDGCHKNVDGSIVNGTGDNNIKGPLNDAVYHQSISTAISSTSRELLVNNNEISSISINKNEALKMIEATKTYKDVLVSLSGGTVQEVEILSKFYPVDPNYNYVTSAYGWRLHPVNMCCAVHNGMDIGAGADANIYSIANGIVVSNVGSNVGYGNYVVIGHGDYDGKNYEYYSLYAHQIRKSSVKIGQEVIGGELIGNVGSTGLSTGNHLHVEIYTLKNGSKTTQNPYSYFSGVSLTGKIKAEYDSLDSCVAATGKQACS